MNTPQQHFRTCHLCEAMCGVVIEHQEGEILSIKGDKADVLSKGHICPKAVALKDLQEDPDRIRRPMKRIGSEWVEISWNDAFDIVEKNIKRIQAEHGHDAVGVYIGNPTAHHPGAILMLGPLLAVIKTGSRFSASSVDQLAVMFATHEMLGNPALMTVPDLDRCEFLLMIGANPAASNGSLMSAGDPMGKIQAISTRGGRVVVVDPRRTESAIKADQHLFIRPGTDVFLLAAMLQVLFAEDRVDLGHLATFTDGLELLRNAISGITPESVAEITGISATEIRTLARNFAAAERAVCYGRIGSNVQEFGGLTAWLIYALNIVTGNLDREGGAMFTQPAIDIIGLSGASDLAGGLNTERTRVRGLPIFAGEKPVAVMAEEMLTKGAGQIRALITHAGNPVLSTPNGRQLDEALAGLEFMVCIDIYLNETTRHAHLILPPTGALERGHFDILLNAWAVRNIVKYSPPLLPAPVDSRHDWQIMLELIVRLNSKNALDRTLWRGLQR
ncbi:MAG: molybdopterin-dependent oxidoreductase, partial [Candidatus Saccharibacteria bacterium]|nr:molybdopterin-dependent oxidoreductase [Moraxellaceae bacterium]